MKNEIIEKYIEKFGNRFSKSKKRKFQKELINDFEQLGYSSEIESKRVKFSKVENVFIGNIKHAKHAIVIPYNTPSKVFWYKNDLYPQDGYTNMKKMFIPTYIPMFLGYGILLLFIYVFPLILTKATYIFAYPIIAIYMLLFLLFVVRGFPNKHNATNNSGSIALALSLALSLSAQKRKEVLFIFSDGNKVSKANGNANISEYMNKNKKTNISLISLFCLGQGDTIQIAQDKSTKGLGKDLSKLFKGKTELSSKTLLDNDKYNTMIDGLPKSLMISSGEISEAGLKASNIATSKDKEIKIEVLNDVEEMLKGYIEKKK